MIGDYSILAVCGGGLIFIVGLWFLQTRVVGPALRAAGKKANSEASSNANVNVSVNKMGLSEADAIEMLDKVNYSDRDKLLEYLYRHVGKLHLLRARFGVIYNGFVFGSDFAEQTIEGFESCIESLSQIEGEMKQAFWAVNSFDDEVSDIINDVQGSDSNVDSVFRRVSQLEAIRHNNSVSLFQFQRGILGKIPEMSAVMKNALSEFKDSKNVTDAAFHDLSVAVFGEQEVQNMKVQSFFAYRKMAENIESD